MNILIYMKNSFLKIIYFICILFVINLILLSSKPINASINDIAYMNFLIIVISIFFMVIDYKRWKTNYNEISKAIHNEQSIDYSLPDSNSSFEIQLIKNIIHLKNVEMNSEIQEIKELLDGVNDYITKWVHEIKIPIAVCELIADKIEETSQVEDINHISEELRIEIERIKFLINQVLYTSRSSNYSEDLQISEINIEKVTKDIIKRNAVFFISKNIELTLENINFNVMTDKKWILYIIDQIINNAYKYVNKGGKIKIHAEEDKKAVKLFIRDNGMGISEKDIKRIFDKGFTGENGRKLSKSTGMGLYLSKKIAHKLNHDLLVESKKGCYTEFIIYFYKLSDYFKVT